jgi:hypothetical protein
MSRIISFSIFIANTLLAIISANTPIEITAAIIWFSVRDETKIPIAINAPPIKSTPAKHPAKVGTLILEITYSCCFAIPSRVYMLRKALTAKVPAKSVYAARNLANTMPARLTGLVRRSLSVPAFFSSLNNFIVRSGMRMTKKRRIMAK